MISCSDNKHIPLHRKIITSSQLAFPKIFQMKKNTPSVMKSTCFLHGLMLGIITIIILRPLMLQYSDVKPGTVEESVQNMQLMTRQEGLRLSYYWLLEPG
jgi:hypothetical protein